MRALCVGNVWGRRNAMWKSSVARPRAKRIADVAWQ